MCLLPSLKWSSTVSSLGIVQWDFTRRDHLGDPGRVSGSGPVNQPLHQQHLSLPMLRMILLLPPPIEEVPLPPLTFSSRAGTVSVGSDVHTFDFGITCTTCPAKPIFFVYIEACCLLLFAKVKNLINSPWYI